MSEQAKTDTGPFKYDMELTAGRYNINGADILVCAKNAEDLALACRGIGLRLDKPERLRPFVIGRPTSQLECVREIHAMLASVCDNGGAMTDAMLIRSRALLAKATGGAQ